MSFWAKFKVWIKLFGADVLSFIEPFAVLFVKSGGVLLQDIALEAVTKMAGTSLSNAEKREQAFRQIKIMAEKKSIEAGENVIRAALELAVAKLKS